MTTPGNAGLRERAERWIADDPDPDDRAELRRLLDATSDGGSGELADRFAGALTFGTAGLRGPLRAGPNGMNRAVVRGAAAGLVAWLLGRQGAEATPVNAAGIGIGPVVIGYDARHRSREFAEETARVVTGTGLAALVLPGALPTPVLAYAVRRLDAAAGVMVTASHNPPRDNGYKVYLGRRFGGDLGAGAQIVPPVDAEIEAAIRAVGPLAEVPLGPPGTVPDGDLVASYVEAVSSLVDSDGPRELSVAYTPLHGVGGAVLRAAFAAAGFPEPSTVDSQAEPDPDFPTVPFPNPEEPGAMDRVTALAAAVHADLALANDPDADRCAVAVPDGEGWRMLRGDEVGVLLADHLMRRGVVGRYATTIVSSSLLRAMCQARGLPYAQTLTGFKWIVRAGEQLVYGYEEALGYCVAPHLVRDKDGISAALLICELAAGLKARGRTLTDRLDEIAAQFGVYATDQLSVRVEDLTEIERMMSRLRARPPARLLGQELTSVEDRLPDSDVLILRYGRVRVAVRPSGTEPKLKAYLEVVEPTGDDGVPAARQRAAAAVAALRAETAEFLGLG